MTKQAANEVVEKMRVGDGHSTRSLDVIHNSCGETLDVLGKVKFSSGWQPDTI